MIVIEGMDNSGKSTLGVRLGNYLHYQVQESEGPPREIPGYTAAEEINQRVDKYAQLTNTLFVRHPVTSNAIYGQVRPEGDPISSGRRLDFYRSQPILIYCDAGERGLGAHIEKAHDTKRHIRDITQNYQKLLQLYRLWAAEKAYFIYRIGDDVELLCYLVSVRKNFY